MSMWHCIEAARKELEADMDYAEESRLRFKKLGERAQAMWKEQADAYERAGHPRHTAEALAGEDVKAALKREAGEQRHTFISHMGALRRIEADVQASPGATAAQRAERAHFEQTGLYRYLLGRLNRYYAENHRNWKGDLTNPDRVKNVVREMMDEQTGDQVASEFAKAIREQIEFMRLKLNELGANIGKIDAYGFRHNHDAHRITMAKFEGWQAKIDPLLDWRKINDPFTGRPMQAADGDPPPLETRKRFLKEVFDNIVFGRESRDPNYNAPRGMNIARSNSQSRVLHFKNADAWMAYQSEFGMGTPHSAITGQLYSMARDYVHMRAFGKSPELGIDYYSALQMNAARKAGNTDLAAKIIDDADHAKRIVKIERGIGWTDGNTGRAQVARFFSNLRMVQSAAHLDRAIFANMSDANTINLTSVANNLRPEANPIARQIGLAQMMDRDDLLRIGHVMDGWTDAAGIMDRWNHDTMPSQWAERLSYMSMKTQGLINWTDRGRRNIRELEWGNLAREAGKPFEQIDTTLRRRLQKWGVSPSEWADFSNRDLLFKAKNGATFLAPEYWRQAVDGRIDGARADEILLKVNAMIAEGVEQAVPSNSPWMRAALGEGSDLRPGTPLYEVMKSGLAYKSFPMAFMRAQYRALAAMPDNPSRWRYGAFMLATTTIAGAVSIQVSELSFGRDPQPMTPDFWWRATLKGGGLGILGDLINAGGEASFGGYAAYFAGPMAGLAQDVAGLAGSAMTGAGQILTGQELDTDMAKKLDKFIKRNTPMGDSPLVGPFYRLVIDNMMIMLDPEVADTLARAAKRREKNTGNAEWWPTMSATPQRAPNLMGAFGQ